MFDVSGQTFRLNGGQFMMNGADARGVDSFVILLDRSFVRGEDPRG